MVYAELPISPPTVAPPVMQPVLEEHVTLDVNALPKTPPLEDIPVTHAELEHEYIVES